MEKLRSAQKQAGGTDPDFSQLCIWRNQDCFEFGVACLGVIPRKIKVGSARSLRPARPPTCFSGAQEHITPPSPPQLRIVRRSMTAQIAFLKMNRILGTNCEAIIDSHLTCARQSAHQPPKTPLNPLGPFQESASWRCPPYTSPSAGESSGT